MLSAKHIPRLFAERLAILTDRESMDWRCQGGRVASDSLLSFLSRLLQVSFLIENHGYKTCLKLRTNAQFEK